MLTWYRAACWTCGVAGILVAFTLPVGRVSMACLVASLLGLALQRELGRRREERRIARSGAATPSTTVGATRDLIDLVDAREEEEQKRGYSCIRFEAPLLACPRDEFEEVLARHEAAIRSHLPAILFLARKDDCWREPFDRLQMGGAEIDLHGGNGPPRLVFRSDVWMLRRFRSFLSIHDGAFGYPGHRRMRVAVADEDAVSVRKLELVTENLPGGRVRRELVLVPDDLLFEPVRQEIKDERGAWVRRWRATTTSPVHEERIVPRPPAATFDEWVDRFFAAMQGELRGRLEVARKDGRGTNQILLSTYVGEEFGPGAVLYSTDRSWWAEQLASYPKCLEVLQRPWPPGWIPVFVTRPAGDFAGIRWLAATPGADVRIRPAGATDGRQWRFARTKRKARG
jgi:hypothetical protein